MAVECTVKLRMHHTYMYNESTKVHQPRCRHNAFNIQDYTILVGGCGVRKGNSSKSRSGQLSPRSRRTE